MSVERGEEEDKKWGEGCDGEWYVENGGRQVKKIWEIVEWKYRVTVADLK